MKMDESTRQIWADCHRLWWWCQCRFRHYQHFFFFFFFFFFQLEFGLVSRWCPKLTAHFAHRNASMTKMLHILRKLILQTARMRSHPMGLDVWCLVGPFVYFYSSYVRTAKALVRLRGCAGSPELSLVAYVVRTIISLARLFCKCFHWSA